MEEALELRAQARKKAKSAPMIFSKFSSKSAKTKGETEELFTKAATTFLRLEKYSEAADSFCDAAHYSTSVYTAASLNVEAAKAFIKANDADHAIKCYADAISKFALKGPVRRAAELAIELGKLYEKQEMYANSLKAYNRAIEWFEEAGEASNAANARFEAADLSAILGEYGDAIQSFESAAEQSSQDRANRFKLKGYFLKAGLCYIANHDFVGLDLALPKYSKWDRAFTATDQYILLTQLGKAVKTMDLPLFESTLYAYDKRHRLNKWEVEISLKIKQRFTNKPEEELL